MSFNDAPESEMQSLRKVCCNTLYCGCIVFLIRMILNNYCLLAVTTD
jgi:hypothetical protein